MELWLQESVAETEFVNVLGAQESIQGIDSANLRSLAGQYVTLFVVPHRQAT